jgi:hypothetical protein
VTQESARLKSGWVRGALAATDGSGAVARLPQTWLPS